MRYLACTAVGWLAGTMAALLTPEEPWAILVVIAAGCSATLVAFWISWRT